MDSMEKINQTNSKVHTNKFECYEFQKDSVIKIWDYNKYKKHKKLWGMVCITRHIYNILQLINSNTMSQKVNNEAIFWYSTSLASLRNI